MAFTGSGTEDRWHLSIDTARVTGWISLRLGKLCMMNTEVFCAATIELGNSSSYSVCAVRYLSCRVPQAYVPSCMFAIAVK